MTTTAPAPTFRVMQDAILHLPVMLFLSAAIGWLVVAAFLAFVAAWKLIDPAWLDCIPWFHYGLLQPIADNALIYGWASQAGIGVGLWVLARLGGGALAREKLLLAAGIFWNLGVLLGLCGIVAGRSTGVDNLEFPGFAAMILLVAFLCIAIWSLFLLRDRLADGLFVSQWYLFAAFLWFPWFYATSNLLLVWCPIPGPAQTPIAWWFGNNLVWLWLAPICLACAYYMIPTAEKRPLRAYPWSVMAFWCVAFLAGWSGTRPLTGGPVPAWLASAGVAASVLILIPVTVIGINLFGTLREGRRSLALQFILFGIVCFVTWAGLNAAGPWLGAVTRFSDFETGTSTLVRLGFVTMALVGAIHFVLPRVAGIDLVPRGAAWHFWLMVWGLGLAVVSLWVGGLIQGFALHDPAVEFVSAVQFALPFRFVRAIGGLVFFLGALAFAGRVVEKLLEKADVLPNLGKGKA